MIFRKGIFLLFTIFIAWGLIGCNREVTELMSVEIVEICITETVQPDVFAISVLVMSVLPDKCIEDHQKNYTKPHVFDFYPLYEDGDTIQIEIIQTVSVGSVVCDLASPYYHDIIFVGFCKPGEYTLDVNGNLKKFQVG